MSNPQPCNDEIFKNGKGCCVLDGNSNNVELFVQKIAEISKQQVDWHYSGGRANVLYIGDYDIVINTIHSLLPEISNYDVRLLSIGGPALYRQGDYLPDNVIAIL